MAGKTLIKEIPFNRVSINQSFWADRQRAGRNKTIVACIEKCESTERINNFKRAGGKMGGAFEGFYYDDSDVYKVLEGIAYHLWLSPDEKLEKKADEWIDIISGAQMPDGYLVTYFIMEANGEKRFTNMERHEDYCLGHMLEAAIAYKKATAKDKFYNTAKRFADCFMNEFGPGKRHYVTGHQELELALVKLFEESGEKKYLDMAYWLLEERGRGYGEGEIWARKEMGSAYTQDDIPVREMTDIKGHAVRAMYLLCGMCDVQRYLPDDIYMAALLRLWDSVVLRNMYATGGIGSSNTNEGFIGDYILPNDTAYSETCASVGMAMWNHRMNLLTGDAKYADIVERELFNAVPAGVSISGDKFFYTNPLASDGGHSRASWFDCSCCPTQMARFVPSIGSYIFSQNDNSVYINQYISSETSITIKDKKLDIKIHSAYPWNGKINIETFSEKGVDLCLLLRIPGWCKNHSVKINGQKTTVFEEKGYAMIMRSFKGKELITIDLDMPVQLRKSHPFVKANRNLLSLTRGPLVYCYEQTAEDKDFNKIVLSEDSKFTLLEDKMGNEDIVCIRVRNSFGEFKLIPYYTWNNCGSFPMSVWAEMTSPQ